MTESKVFAFKRPVGTSKKRLSLVANARDTLVGVGFDKGQEVDIATGGQFSIIDALEAVLEITGPADVTLATWTAADFDLTQIQGQLTSGRIRDFKLIIDRSFVARKPEFVDVIHDKFGKDSVRSTRSHAKFVIVTNAEWKVVIRTSMNLNFNPRLEYLQIVEDPELAAFWLSVADEVFSEEEPGLVNRRSLPAFGGIAGLQPIEYVRMGLDPAKGQKPRMSA